jgi:aminomethyltransferase
MTDVQESKRTPLHDLHGALGGRMVDFAGWAMPVQYAGGIIAEHTACRTKAALFDVSHMGQVELRGEGAAAALERLVPSAITTLAAGKARYTVFTDANGGILDDLIVSNAGDHLYMVVNASRRDHDVAHMRANLAGVDVVERKDLALIAVQGPKAEAVVAALAPAAADLRFMEMTRVDLAGVPCRISRLGYTGEDGYEISVPAGEAERVARAFLADKECVPAGLGARDSLRLEAGLCLYGNDIDAGTSPVEAQLDWIIQKRRREEGGFPGADRILRELRAGAGRKLVGILPDGRAPARQGTQILGADGAQIGQVTSGGFGPTLGGPVSLGYVVSACAEPGTPVSLVVRNNPISGKVVRLPFVPHNYKR